MRRRDFLKTAGAAAAGTGMAGCQTNEDSDGENTTDTPEPTETRQPLKQVGLFLEGEDGGFERPSTLEMGEEDDEEYERQEATVYANVFGGESVDLEVALENGEGEELATFFDDTVEVNDNIEAELDLQYSQIVNELELRGGEYEIVVEAAGENKSAADSMTLELGEPHLDTLHPQEESFQILTDAMSKFPFYEDDTEGFRIMNTKLQRVRDPEAFTGTMNSYPFQPVNLEKFSWKETYTTEKGEAILLDELNSIGVWGGARMHNYDDLDEQILGSKYFDKLEEVDVHEGYEIRAHPEVDGEGYKFFAAYDGATSTLVWEPYRVDDIKKILSFFSGNNESWTENSDQLPPDADITSMTEVKNNHVYACGIFSPLQSEHTVENVNDFVILSPAGRLSGDNVYDSKYLAGDRGELELEKRFNRSAEDVIRSYG